MTINNKRFKKGGFILAFFSALLFNACEAPVTGTEMYDGDPSTNEPTPEEMEEKAEEERKDTTLDAAQN